MTARNQLQGYGYDTAGNLTVDGLYQREYDGFSQLRAQWGDGSEQYYVYTASDERIGVYSAVGDVWNWSLRDENGKVLRQFQSFPGNPSAPWLWVQDYVYRDGQLLGGERVAEEGGRRHYHLDHLGTARVVTGDGGLQVARHDYYPFGNEITPLRQETMNGLSREDPMKFTGHERDFTGGTMSENTNYDDYMHARYYKPAAGRFLPVDPVLNKGALRKPQLWNRYSYVSNNPLNFVDPDGRLLQLSGCAKDQSSDACKGQMSLCLSTFGKQSGEAAKYLTVGKNGIVGFNGISGSAFAAKFGLMGRATNYLVSNRAATFSLVTGRTATTEGHRGAYFDGGNGVGGTIGIDPSRFPNSKHFFGITVSSSEALAHVSDGVTEGSA